MQGGEGGLLFFFGEAPAEWGDLHGRGVGGDGGDVPVPEGLDHLAAGAQPGRARRAQGSDLIAHVLGLGGVPRNPAGVNEDDVAGFDLRVLRA